MTTHNPSLTIPLLSDEVIQNLDYNYSPIISLSPVSINLINPKIQNSRGLKWTYSFENTPNSFTWYGTKKEFHSYKLKHHEPWVNPEFINPFFNNKTDKTDKTVNLDLSDVKPNFRLPVYNPGVIYLITLEIFFYINEEIRNEERKDFFILGKAIYSNKGDYLGHLVLDNPKNGSQDICQFINKFIPAPSTYNSTYKSI